VERLSPILRLSLGLTVLTCTILLTADVLRLLPPLEDPALRERIASAERLSMQAAQVASRDDLGMLRSLLHSAVSADGELLSVAVRSANGMLLVQAGDHRRLWDPPEAEGSTETHMRVPLFRDGRPWGTLEARFAERTRAGLLAALWQRPLVRLLLVMGGIGFVAYGFYLRRNLKHLDPSAVIPARVQAALDVMAEGVILVDAQERIVLANAAFARRVGVAPASLLGVDAASLRWRPDGAPGATLTLPWRGAVREGAATIGGTLRLDTPGDGERVFVVNASPVLDGWGRPKGAIATFDDATELERKTTALEEALGELEKSRDEIRLQNDELQVLARRDPLTGVANRRAFMARLEAQLAAARRSGRELCCLMVDIDHFKKTNDDHGHTMGDEVIQRVAQALAAEMGSSEEVCRYGGEEFCVALAEGGLEQAMRVAERVNKKVQLPGFARVPVAVSIGVTSTRWGARSLLELIEQADEALYASKQRGRNRVTRFDEVAPGGGEAGGRSG
jgi:diguanylate cyclase (GGDEF)-like protein/PAS domain S-box-containing protein